MSHQCTICFQKGFLLFYIDNNTFSWWLISRHLCRQAFIDLPIWSLPEDSRAVFGNMRKEGGAADSLQQRCLLKLQAWLANVARVKRQDVLASLGTLITPLLSEAISWCLGSLSARANVHNSMWLDVFKQEGSCQVSLLICFHPPSPICACLGHSMEAVQTEETGRSWCWVHPSLVLSRWVSLGKLLYLSLCLGLTDCKLG